jgi:hypothetical protein
MNCENKMGYVSNNMLYYFVVANLIMCKNLHMLLRTFLSNSAHSKNECVLIYSGSYGKGDLDKEYLYAAWLDANRLAIIYEDRYSLGEVFFIFSYDGALIELISFGSSECELYNPKHNKFKEEVYMRSAATYFGASDPTTYDEFNIFFRKLFKSHWLAKLSFCGDLNNIVFDYIGFYRC